MTSSNTETTVQLQCMKQGGPFQLIQAPKPRLAPDEVLIQQRVIALNLIDVKQRDTGILVPSWPRVLGFEGGGIVRRVGSEVRGLQVGDEVAAWESGAFQEYVAVSEYLAVKKPKNISLEEAVSLP
jgi:NADPH:quinone reductase-like Zn-dependent oxidoreductase